MANIITAFSKPEDAKSIKGILARNGYESAFICTSGAQVLSAAEDLDSGIVVCGFRFEDMIYEELRQMLPSAFDMLMIASPAKWSGQKQEGIVYLPMPLKVHDLLCTMEMMVQARRRLRRRERSQPRQRSSKEQAQIDQAKALLMERNGMTEAEAHRYIQKCSMDNGTSLTETAQMIISLM